MNTYGEYLTNLLNGFQPKSVERECVARVITFGLQQDHWNYEWNLTEVAEWLQIQLSRLGNDSADKIQRSMYQTMLDAAKHGWSNEPVNEFVELPLPAQTFIKSKSVRMINYEGQSKRLLRHRIRMIKADRANRRIYERNRKAMY